MMTNYARLSALIPMLVALATGCVGYRTYSDPAVDMYDLYREEHVLREAVVPTRSRVKVRYVVNTAHYVRDVLQEPVSARWPGLEWRARQTIEDVGLFKPQNIGPEIEPPDYCFIFNIDIRDTDKPWLTSGLIWPFFRTREYHVRLAVLDAKGHEFAAYVGSAETFEARHIFVFWLTPFYCPAWADRAARRSAFHALAVKLITDREKFVSLEPKTERGE